ncbi:ferritin-like metal-binding protein YciE [Mucilaginibacter sp. UYP25]|uniref:DUF892 family protein n=1 Tax=unclassified Mucilaginibacter TaxID=2617802 RepID=UPI0033982814
MEYQEKWTLSSNGKEGRLNKQEMLDMFLQTLTDIYHVKKYLLTYLPEMAKRSNIQNIRYSILNASTDINSQVMRLDMILAIIRSESESEIIINKGELRLDTYIRSTLKKSEDYKTNIALISHFIMLESIEIASFELLTTMSCCIRNPTIKDMIHQNLTEAKNNKKVFQELLSNYIL